MQAIGAFTAGEDIVVALDAIEGSVAAVSTIAARMRRVRRMAGEAPIYANEPAIDLVADARAASGSLPAGWTISLAAATSAELSGLYAIDATLGTGAGIVKTEVPALIRIRQAA